MFWNCEDLLVCMLLVPVVLNILLPLVMLLVWLVKYMVTGKSLPDKVDETVTERRMPIPGIRFKYLEDNHYRNGILFDNNSRIATRC